MKNDSPHVYEEHIQNIAYTNFLINQSLDIFCLEECSSGFLEGDSTKMRKLRFLVISYDVVLKIINKGKVDNVISAILARQIMLGYPDSIAFKLQY